MNIVLIPARGGSKRIPGKNLKPLGGKPLLLWTIEAAKQLGVHVWVSTEDADVTNLVQSVPNILVHERSMLAATDVATDLDVVWDFLEKHDIPDTIVYLRPTTPFRSVKLLQEIADFQLPVNFSSIRSIQESPESAFKQFTKNMFNGLAPIPDETGNFCSDQPNQFVQKTYQANGYIDILFPKRQFFRRHDIFGPNIYGYETPATIELDTQEQWGYAEYLIAKGLA